MKLKEEENNYVLYHNSKCSKSRTCLKIIQEKKITCKEFHYLKEGLTLSNLNEIIDNLHNPLNALIRTNEKYFKQNKFDINNKTEIANFLFKFPICIQRPLFFNGKKYIICRPPEEILNHL